MYLTSRARGRPRALHDHEQLELLLESFVKQVEEIVSEVDTTVVIYTFDIDWLALIFAGEHELDARNRGAYARFGTERAVGLGYQSIHCHTWCWDRGDACRSIRHERELTRLPGFTAWVHS